MSITLKFNASLKKYMPEPQNGVIELDDLMDGNLKTIMENFDMNFNDLGFCAINGKIVPKINILKGEAVLQDGDYVELFSELKGG